MSAGTRAYLARLVTRCARCRALVVWTVTDRRARMMVDAEADLAGTVAVHVDGAGTVRGRVVSGDRPLEAHEELHVTHFASCRPPTPQAEPESEAQANVIPIQRARQARAARAARDGGR